VLDVMYGNSARLMDRSEKAWDLKYATEFHLTSDSALFPHRDKWAAQGYASDEYGRWCGPDGHVALPLYQGVMIRQFDFSASRYLDGTGPRSRWELIDWTTKRPEPQFLMDQATYRTAFPDAVLAKVAFRDVSYATNERSMIAASIGDWPCGNVLGVLTSRTRSVHQLPVILNSLCFDWALRCRMVGSHLNLFVVSEAPVPLPEKIEKFGSLLELSLGLQFPSVSFAPVWFAEYAKRTQELGRSSWRSRWAVTRHERLRRRVIADAVVACLYQLDEVQLRWLLRDCDHPSAVANERSAVRRFDTKGFWRVDKGEPPECRHTVLTLAAFADISAIIAAVTAAGGTRDDAIAAFCGRPTKPLPRLNRLIGSIDTAEGWMLPENFRLADLGLGHDDRAEQPQPVAATLGPRFYDWQLSQDAAESWRECALHARNLLGAEGFEKLQAELEGRDAAPLSQATRSVTTPAGKPKKNAAKSAETLFE
jgi:hypothetical protein